MVTRGGRSKKSQKMDDVIYRHQPLIAILVQTLRLKKSMKEFSCPSNFWDKV